MFNRLINKIVVALTRSMLPKQFKGSIEVTLPSGQTVMVGGELPGEKADLKLKNFNVLWAGVRRAQLGFFERYIAGDVESRDPTAFFRFYLQNRSGLDGAAKGIFFPSFVDKLWHKMRANTKRKARENIAQHYDLGNDFYKLWLDSTMTYSSAFFDESTNSLEAAQRKKYNIVMQLAEVGPGTRILEIGSGWGGFAEEAAKIGATVVGITLSNEQLTYSQERIEKAKLFDRVQFKLLDYRDSTGVFDAVASIEMIEAVGEAHWPAYFSTVFSRLKPGGTAAIQGITISEDNWVSYRGGVDFIQRYVFPGGMLLTKTILREQAEKAGLVLEKIETFGGYYAETLRHWRQKFELAWPDILRLGYDVRFKRLWTLYLCYCEAGFDEGIIDVGIYQLRKPLKS